MTDDLQLDELVLSEYRQHLDLSSPETLRGQGTEWLLVAALPMNSLHTVYIFTCTTPQGVHVGRIDAVYDDLDVFVSNALPLPLPRSAAAERIAS